MLDAINSSRDARHKKFESLFLPFETVHKFPDDRIGSYLMPSLINDTRSLLDTIWRRWSDLSLSLSLSLETWRSLLQGGAFRCSFLRRLPRFDDQRWYRETQLSESESRFTSSLERDSVSREAGVFTFCQRNRAASLSTPHTEYLLLAMRTWRSTADRRRASRENEHVYCMCRLSGISEKWLTC